MKYRILQKKWFLYLTEFFAGMALMAVELGTSRLIAPYFSSSQIVWTIIIGTIMIAMALGNVIGGKWADKSTDPGKLFRRILIAGIWIALIPVLGKYVIAAITALIILTVNTAHLVWAALITCLVLFVYPLFLLGTVTPTLTKLTLQDLGESGSVAGRLGACNTIGSIIGTFLPTFVTIPSVGTSVTFLIFAGILIALALIYFISTGTHKAATVAGIVIFVLCCIFGHRSHFAFWENDLTYEGESVYNYLQVKDDAEKTVLSTNVMFGVQSMYMKQPGFTGMYYDYALAAPVMTGKKTPSVLILGMGTGTFATQCDYYFPGCDVSGVEIDGKITELAHTYFHLDEKTPVATYDGRAYLNVDQKKYDVIMVDAYQDITIPFQMSSVEFFTLVRDHLAEGGVMVMNMNMRGSGGEDDICTYLSDTVTSVFPYAVSVDVPWTTNREMFASLSDPAAALEAGTAALADGELKTKMLTVRQALATVGKGDHIFTDDCAPVELIGMRSMDAMIKDELGYYKDVFETEGLPGLLSLLGL